jgi:hypothetical protein
METIDSLLEEMNSKMKNGFDISPGEFLDYACKLNVLILDLDNELVDTEMQVNKKMAENLLQGETSAKARALVQATDDYWKLLRLRAKRKQVEQFIMLSKKRVDEARWSHV